MEQQRRRDWLATAILALLPLLLFADVLAGVTDFYMRDIARYYYPAKHVLRDVVLGGEFPYWNRFFAAGQPLAANPEHEVFYPLTWLILLPSYDLGFRLLILVHLSIGLATMFALLRSIGLARPAAVFGALSFGLGGVMLSYANLLPYLFSAAWLPLTCLYARRFLIDGSRRDFALAALVLTIQLLIGEPTTAMQTGLLLGCYALSRTPRLANLARLGLIGAVALVASAVQTIPTIGHFRDSVRTRGFTFETVSEFSMPALRLGELAFPNLFGHVVKNDRILWWGAAHYDGGGPAFFFSIYCGLAVLVLAVAGAIARTRGTRLFAALSAASIVLAMGRHTPLLRLLYDSGLAKSTRYPEKFILTLLFAAIVFAAVVLDRILAGDERLRRIAARVALGVAIAGGAVAAFSFSSGFESAFGTVWTLRGGFEELLELSRRDWLIATAKAILLVLLLHRAAPTRRWLAVAAAFLLLDLLPLPAEVAPRIDASLLREPPRAAMLLPRGEFRLFHEADWYADDEEARQYLGHTPETYWVLRNGLFPPFPALYGLETVLERDIDRTALLPSEEFTEAMWELARKRHDWTDIAANMANVRFRAEYRPFERAWARAGGDRRRLEPVRFIEHGGNPRYWFALGMVSIRDREDFVAKVTGLRGIAYVTGGSFAPARGVVRSVRESANAASIDVEAEGRAFLVMSVTPHRWWRVTIDGRQVTPVVTNLGFQGVAVPAGRHTVAMRYRNRLIDAGAAVSLISLAALIVLARRR